MEGLEEAILVQIGLSAEENFCSQWAALSKIAELEVESMLRDATNLWLYHLGMVGQSETS